MKHVCQDDENLNFATDNLNAIYIIRKLFLSLAVLFLLFQQFTLAAIREMTSTPDSVYLSSLATSGDDGRSGPRFARSIDKENWFEIGRNHGYLRCDYSHRGSQKKMLDPYLKQSSDGEWICTWKPNDHDGYGQVTSKDLINRISQECPHITPDFDGVRVKAIVVREEQKGNINRVAWTSVDGLDKNRGWNQYRDSLHGERPIQGGERLAGLKPVKAMVTVQPEGAKVISDVLPGTSFEDINYSANGGLHAELIQNRDFEYDPSDRERDKNWNSTHSWALEGEKTTFTIGTIDSIRVNNPYYAVLNVEQPGVVLENTGFDGITLNTREKHDFSILTRVPQGKSNKLQVRLIDGKGNACGETSLAVFSRQWKTYKVVITTKATTDTYLEIIPQSVDGSSLDMISLFPQNIFKGCKNGSRKDLAQVLAGIRPRFIHFPDGCVAHGDGLKNIYQWKNTVGPLETRKAQHNPWGYHQNMGLGYFEYFQFCEDIGTEPSPALAAGVPRRNSACHGDLRGEQQGGIPMSEMGVYIQDILDLIEWANGDTKKIEWGKIRAEVGHPGPFNLKYTGIGDEDLITDIFEERFTMISSAVKEKYPEMIVVGTVGPSNEGTDYVEGWKLTDELGIPMVDEHYYQTSGRFLNNQDFYDKYDRSEKTKVYLSEYVTHIPERKANIETVLTEALYPAVLERDEDVVHMTSYAPLLVKEGHTQWNPDLIYSNNQEVKPTTGYYVQKLYGQNAGNECLPPKITLDNRGDQVWRRIAAPIVRDSASGDVIMKLVNLLPVEVNTNADLSGIGTMQSSAKRTVLTDRPADIPLPIKDTVGVAEKFDYQSSAYSSTVIRIKKANEK